MKRVNASDLPWLCVEVSPNSLQSVEYECKNTIESTILLIVLSFVFIHEPHGTKQGQYKLLSFSEMIQNLQKMSP